VLTSTKLDVKNEVESPPEYLRFLTFDAEAVRLKPGSLVQGTLVVSKNLITKRYV
jgi:hypothetical protein